MAGTSLTGRSPMIASTRGLKTGDLVTVPAGIERREVVVRFVLLDDRKFTDIYGTCHYVADAELVPLSGAVAEVPALGPHAVPIGPSRAWADLIALPTETLRAMAASGLLTAAEQWGAEDELGERDDPYPTAEEIASRLCRCLFGMRCAGHRGA